MLLVPNREHQNVPFTSTVPLVGFKKGKSLKDILFMAKVRKEAQEKGFSKGCGGKCCQVCKYVKDSELFESKSGQSFKIRGENNCNNEMIVHLVNCKCCQKQYVGNTNTKFRLRFNNYKTCHTRHSLNKPVPQESFHAQFKEQSHKGMDDWLFILIDKAENVVQLRRRREALWQYKLCTFVPDGLMSLMLHCGN